MVDIGETSYARVLADDLDGNGQLDLLLATMNGNLYAFQSRAPAPPEAVWPSEVIPKPSPPRDTPPPTSLPSSVQLLGSLWSQQHGEGWVVLQGCSVAGRQEQGRGLRPGFRVSLPCPVTPEAIWPLRWLWKGNSLSNLKTGLFVGTGPYIEILGGN